MRSFVKKYLWLLPPLFVFLLYRSSLDHYFVFDDFIWLFKGQTFTLDPLQIFKLDGLYFDPVIHLLFWITYTLSGLSFYHFQLVDIVIHAVNSVLLYRLVRGYILDETLALYSSLFFATTFITVDAVVWPSATVDTVGVFFTLLTLVLFVKFLEGGERRVLLLSVVCYLLALGCKGTPAVVPIIVSYLLVERRSLKDGYKYLIPYFSITFLYFAAVITAVSQKAPVSGGFHLNYRNLVLSLNDLFYPERLMPGNLYLATGLVLLLIVLFLAVRSPETGRAKMFGLYLLAVGILPVLVTTDFKLCTSSFVNLLSSPSHRLYLSSVGMAIFVGAFLRSVELKVGNGSCGCGGRMLFGGVVATLLIINCSEVLKREAVWKSCSDNVRLESGFLAANREDIERGGVVGMINMTGSRGFWGPMFNDLLGLDGVDFVSTSEYERYAFEHPAIVSRAESASFFVKGNYRFYNLSEPFRDLLLALRKVNDVTDSLEKEQAAREYQERLALFQEAVDRSRNN